MISIFSHEAFDFQEAVDSPGGHRQIKFDNYFFSRRMSLFSILLYLQSLKGGKFMPIYAFGTSRSPAEPTFVTAGFPPLPPAVDGRSVNSQFLGRLGKPVSVPLQLFDDEFGFYSHIQQFIQTVAYVLSDYAFVDKQQTPAIISGMGNAKSSEKVVPIETLAPGDLKLQAELARIYTIEGDPTMVTTTLKAGKIVEKLEKDNKLQPKP